MSEQRWAFVVRVQDAPGALAALASVFSMRGVSLEVLLGNGLKVAPEGGSIVLAFRANEAKMETLLRVSRRLERVIDVRALPYSAPELRAVAVAHLAPPVMLPEDLGVQVELLTNSSDPTYLLSGGAQAVDDALTALRASGAVRSAMISVMPV